MKDTSNNIFKDENACRTYLTSLSVDELHEIINGAFRENNPEIYHLIQSIIIIKQSNPSISGALASPMEKIGQWLGYHKFIEVIICIILAIIFFKRDDGDPGSMIILGLVGLYPLLGFYRGFATIFRKGFSLFSLRTQKHVLLLSAVLLCIALFGIVPLLIVVFEEWLIQFTCTGGRCAQGGIGIVFFLPAPWLSYLAVRLANFYFSNLWPYVLMPDFSLHQKTKISRL